MLIFSFVGIFSFFISPGFSLSWQDEEWLKPGCPKTVSGNWTASNPANTKLRSLSINNKQVIYTSQNGEGQQFQIIKSTSNLKNPYMEMELKSFNKEDKFRVISDFDEKSSFLKNNTPKVSPKTKAILGTVEPITLPTTITASIFGVDCHATMYRSRVKADNYLIGQLSHN